MFVFQLYLFAVQLNIGESVKVVKAKKQNCRVCACAHAREPHFYPSFCCEFLSSIPSPLSLPFESKKSQFAPQNSPKSSSILFDNTKSSLSSTRNFVPIEQKGSPIKQDIFSHKTQKTSEIIQKISHVFPKTSDVFSRISHVFENLLDPNSG